MTLKEQGLHNRRKDFLTQFSSYFWYSFYSNGDGLIWSL